MTTVSLQSTPLSNNTLPIFKSELIQGHELRVLGSYDQPLFIAKDVAKMLGYKNINRDINRHVDDEDILTYKQVQERGGTEIRNNIYLYFL